MQAKRLSIKYKRVVIDAKKYCEITDIQGYTENELPEDYFNEYPIMFMIDVTKLYLITNDKEFELETIYDVGDVLCEEHFNKLVRIMQVCGEKLHNINEMIKVRNAELKEKSKELEKVWNGEEEIVI